ncbi:TPA: hypothetical protein OZL24_003234, partial [Legionella pneumophila]|nr:hypothetical protein [Legionella pneumophila]
NPLANYGYDIWFESALQSYVSSLDSNQIQRKLDHDSMSQVQDKCKACLTDAIWSLCCKNILRPGVSFLDKTWSPNNKVNDGFSVTQYGKLWLDKADMASLLPADPNKLSLLFAKYQDLFGHNYFKRAREAVNCYFAGNYLACCVMCGAATESILLSAAFEKEDKDQIIAMYKSSGGRRRIENLLFCKAREELKRVYNKYTDLIKFWRDETGHGHDTDVDHDEAYISMITLLRFALFIQEHWDELTRFNSIALETA